MTVRFGSTLGQRCLTCGSSAPGGMLVTSSSPLTKCDCELEALHQRVRVVDVLRERHVEHRPRRLIELESGELGVAHDADDAERADVLRQVEAEVLTERILVALEEALHERLVDDRDVLRRLVVGGRECAAARASSCRGSADSSR